MFDNEAGVEFAIELVPRLAVPLWGCVAVVGRGHWRCCRQRRGGHAVVGPPGCYPWRPATHPSFNDLEEERRLLLEKQLSMLELGRLIIDLNVIGQTEQA